MRKSAFDTVRTVGNMKEAEALLALLRHAGLHPVELSVSTPLRLTGAEKSFPIQLPPEEAHAARMLLESRDRVSKRPAYAR